MTTILIGIDDTDNLTSRGTGHLARQLGSECRRRGIRVLAVTRHQFLLDRRIPYTSHNSGACVAVVSDEGVTAVEFAFDFVAERSAEGSDPGVCIAQCREVGSDVIAFGHAAASRIVEMDDAYRLASGGGLMLRGLGGTRLGVIGALGAVGLRAEGNEGRFIDLPGLRELPDRVAASDFEQLGIAIEYRYNDRCPSASDVYATFGWVRPRLRGGRAVLIVEWSDDHDAWIPVDRKKNKPVA